MVPDILIQYRDRHLHGDYGSGLRYLLALFDIVTTIYMVHTVLDEVESYSKTDVFIILIVYEYLGS